MSLRPLAALALASVLVAGCGRFGFDSIADVGIDSAARDAGPADASTDAGHDAGSDASFDSGMDAGSDVGLDAGSDAGMDAGSDAGADASTPIGPFGPPRMITELASPMATDDPTLTADRLELFFNRSDDIYRTTRATTASPWGSAAAVTELNSGSSESSPEVSADGLTIYFASSRGGNFDVWVATRASRTTAFGAPTLVPELSSAQFDSNPTPRTDALELVLSRGANGGSRDLYHATRLTTAAPWGAPIVMPELSTTSNDGAPMLAVSGQVIVFYSNRGGDADLYFATRASDLLPFGGTTPLTSVNTGGNEEDPWISEDGHHLVFTRDGQLFETSR